MIQKFITLIITAALLLNTAAAEKLNLDEKIAELFKHIVQSNKNRLNSKFWTLKTSENESEKNLLTQVLFENGIKLKNNSENIINADLKIYTEYNTPWQEFFSFTNEIHRKTNGEFNLKLIENNIITHIQKEQFEELSVLNEKEYEKEKKLQDEYNWNYDDNALSYTFLNPLLAIGLTGAVIAVFFTQRD